MKARKQITIMAALFAAGVLNTQAQVVITEVDANGSSASYGADWFEILNTGSSTLNLGGWKMDDNSASFGSAVALRTATMPGLNSTLSLAPGQIAVFMEGNTSGSTDATLGASFASAWFGVNPPSNLILDFYGGSGVGLSGTADAVNLFDSGGDLMASVNFGASTTGQTFDNAAGLNNTTISQLSQDGINGAFNNGTEIGSPGAVPEPSSLALFGMGATLLGMVYRRKK